MMPMTEKAPQTIFQNTLKQAKHAGTPAASPRLRLQVLVDQLVRWRHWRRDSFHHVAAGLVELAAQLAFLLAFIEAEAAQTINEDDSSGLTLDTESMSNLLDVTYGLMY